MRRYISILIVAISIAATSCNNFLVKEESTPPEGAFVTLAVGKTGSRTILPESYDEVSALKNFVFTATSEDHEPITQTFADYDSLQTAKVPIVAGTWDFSLSATSQHGVQYKGALDNKIIVVGSNNLSFDIQITDLSAEPGALEVQLTFPGTNVTVVKAGLYSIAGEALAGFPEDVLAITGGSTVTYSKDEVPGGSHLIQFSFYGDAECRMFLGMHTESVVIVSGKKSAAIRSIDSINQMYTITYELDGGSFVEGYTAAEKFTRHSSIALPTAFEVDKAGWCLLGWYDNAECSGVPITGIVPGTVQNKTLYAQWGQGVKVSSDTVASLDLTAVAGDYHIMVAGSIYSSTIGTLKSKLTAAGASAKIHLDLSQTTGLTSIGDYAFDGCTGLTSVEIPASVTSIGGAAFRDCSGLTSVEIPAGVTSIGASAFYGCSGLTSVEIPASVTSIGGSVFYGCSGLTSVEIPSSVTSIDSYAFSWCSGLSSVEIPAGVTSIGYGAFEGCSGLTSVEIPAGVTSIGGSAFRGCSGLSSVEIPAGVTSIGGSAFNGCSGLTSVEIPAGVISIGIEAFKGCSGLSSVEIPASVTSIGDYAFSRCSGLTSVEIPSSVTSIGSYAFYGCSGLTSVEIPAGVTSIGYGAFRECSGLTSVEIPAGVTSIGEKAFWDCSGLTSVTFGDTSGWYVTTSETDAANKTGGTAVFPSPTDLAANEVLVRRTYTYYYWYKVD